MLRRLTLDDLFMYRELRLHGLQESPTAFGSSYEEESAFTKDDFARRLSNPKDPSALIIGAFTGDATAKLVGMIGFYREDRRKRAHVGCLVSMYVLPEYRGQHLGAMLLDAAIAHARGLGDIRYIYLGVTEGNTGAASLYRSRGFVTYGLEPDYLLVNGGYYGMEFMMLRL
jgi:ribosomal protein S18 acetylase RimI-like enzyme